MRNLHSAGCLAYLDLLADLVLKQSDQEAYPLGNSVEAIGLAQLAEELRAA